MKHLAPIALLFWFGCSSQATEPVSFKQADSDQSLLWEISGNGLEQPSYLFGTIHMISSDDFYLSPNMVAIAQHVTAHVYELDLDSMDPMAAAELAVLPDNTTLAEHLDADTYARLKSYILDSLEMSAFEWAMIEKMPPLFGGQMIAISQFGEQPKSYEMELKALAEEHEIPVKGLESFADQMAALASITLEAQLELLSENMESMLFTGDLLDKLVGFYVDEQLDSLAALIKDESAGLMEFEDALLNDRNQKWIPEMKTHMLSGPVLFAVGAGHLSGDEGILKLLQNEGFTLTPLENSRP